MPLHEISASQEGWVTVLKTADESVASSTTVQDDDHLFFATVAGAVYQIEVGIIYSNAAGTAPDLKTDWGEDSTVRGNIGGPGISNTDASFTVSVVTNQTNTAIYGTTVARRYAQLAGIHEGNGGTFRMRWAQNTSNATATVVHAGSFIRYRRVY